MKNKILILLLTLAFSNIFAQEELPIYKTSAEKFRVLYNEDKFDSIFHLFSLEFKNVQPLEKTQEFFAQLKKEKGKIVTMEFEIFQSSYASYKTKFDSALLTIYISIDAGDKINGLVVKAYVPVKPLPSTERNTTKMILPFRGLWNVYWGGDTKELNYHVVNQAQKNAFDIVIIDKAGKTYKTNGQANEDYYAFGQYLISPCDGEVVLLTDGVIDNIPGESNSISVLGNSLIIKTINNEYIVFAHFKQNSITVKLGQRIKQGQLLGLCGNSGHSTEPHLHFHLQNEVDINIATGMKCYFDKIMVNTESKMDYSPIKGEKIKNQ